MSIKVRDPGRGSHVAIAVALLSLAGNVLAADLVGVVQRSSGAPLERATVTLRREGADVGGATSDSAGRFVIRNIRPGVYEMRCGGGPVVRLRVNEGLNEIHCRGRA